MGIRDVRVAFKPFEYERCIEYIDAISNSYWTHREWEFLADIQDYHTAFDDVRRTIAKRGILTISQIEVSIKEFWIMLGFRFPKPEIKMVGATFADSEVRHSLAYSHLLEILGCNDEFKDILQVPEIQGRVDYLTKYLKGASSNTDEAYALTLALFSLFIENVSLFSQFLIIKSFRKHENLLKDIDNVIQATRIEEDIHAKFGAYIINILKQEHPEWFNGEFEKKFVRACKKAYDAEVKIVDWIMVEDLPYLTKDMVKEFIKDRFNKSMEMIGYNPVFEVNQDLLKEVQWFYEETYGVVEIDFFATKSTDYNKFSQAFTPETVFANLNKKDYYND